MFFKGFCILLDVGLLVWFLDAVCVCVGCRYIGRFSLIVKKCLTDAVFCENLYFSS